LEVLFAGREFPLKGPLLQVLITSCGGEQKRRGSKKNIKGLQSRPRNNNGNSLETLRRAMEDNTKKIGWKKNIYPSPHLLGKNTSEVDQNRKRIVPKGANLLSVPKYMGENSKDLLVGTQKGVLKPSPPTCF